MCITWQICKQVEVKRFVHCHNERLETSCHFPEWSSFGEIVLPTSFFLMICSLCCHFWSFWDHFNLSFSSSCCTKAIQGALPSAESPGTRPWQWKKTSVLESAKLILREFIVKIREMFTKIGEFQTKWVAKFPPDCFCFQHVQLPPVAANVHHPTRCNQPLTCKLLP